MGVLRRSGWLVPPSLTGGGGNDRCRGSRLRARAPRPCSPTSYRAPSVFIIAAIILSTARIRGGPACLTFDEDVTANGQITINKTGDGAVLLNLASERNWEFRQSGSGPSTALELASVGGGGNTSLIISNPGGRVDVAEGIRAGGPNCDDRLTLLNSNNEPIIDLQAEFGHMDLEGSSQRGRLVLRDAAGNLVIELSAGSGDISLGGSGKDSDIFIKDGAGKTIIQLSAASGDIFLQNADCAEEFDCATDDIEPGDVVVLADGGAVCRSADAARRDMEVVGGADDRSRCRGVAVMEPYAEKGSPRDASTVGVVGAPSVSLPKGGGAIRSIDETFSVNPATGTAAFTIPIPLPPSRRGIRPPLALTYDSGNGNGPFGLGWTIGLPAITRRTDRGLPRYDDASESDVFVLSGAEDLVPALTATGERHVERRTVEGDEFDVHRYRPRVEGLFARIERWTNLQNGEAHWRSISRDNVTTVYGRTADSRIAAGRRTFSWLVCETRDDKGDALLYEYRPEDRTGIDQNRTEEAHRAGADTLRQRYLKRVRYGNRTPVRPEGDLILRDDWMFEVVLDYGEHSATRPQPGDTDPWNARPDAFSTYRPTFEVRTHRLCRRILVFHHFPDDSDVGADCLVRALHLDYEQSPAASLLTRVRSSGYRRDGADYPERSLPPLDLEYTTVALVDPNRPPPTLRQPGDSNLPTGIHPSAGQLVDLDGQGMNGLLIDQGDAWIYQRNRGGGRFGAAELVQAVPALGRRGHRPPSLLDLDGDGVVEFADLAGPTPGFALRDGDGWAAPRTFRTLPALDWDDPNLRFLDMTGDGLADVVLAGNEGLTWHPALGTDGFGEGLVTPWAFDERSGPRLVFADGTDTIALADMSGDGLTDIVRVRNGDVCYWPNLGYGRFGAKVTMRASPVLDTPDLFDPRRIRLADIDGSGTTDLLYLGRGGVDIHLNASGNTWIPARRVEVPLEDTLSHVQVTDLLGEGTACLVWSSTLPGEAERPLRFVDLMETKPYLLASVRNNLGAETHVTYKPSTCFSARDHDEGRAWGTRLPFPVHVVESVEITDHTTGCRYSSRYRYHDGHYDGQEREFRGFGMVEQWDAETVPAGTKTVHSPPLLTRTWFSTGLEARTDERFGGWELERPILPAELDAAEQREAWRALKGSMLRQEIYGEDDGPHASIPYRVVEQTYTVRCLQRRATGRHAVLLPHPGETLTRDYEREADDPRSMHTLTLEVDDFGNVLRQCTVAYGRRRADATLNPVDRAVQARTLVTTVEGTMTTPVDEPSAHRAPLPARTRTFELTGLIPTGPGGRFRRDNLIVVGGDRRLVRHECIRYRRDDLTALLAVGKLQPLALPGQTRTLAFTADTLDAYRRESGANLIPDPAAVLQSRGADGGGYAADDDGWWIPSERVFFDPSADADDPAATAAQERETASEHFHLVRKTVDPFGHARVTDFDPCDLLAVRVRDALDNTVTAEYDYRVLQPRLVTDPNRNRTAATYDALGVSVALTRLGKDRVPPRISADPTSAQLAAFLEDPGPIAAELLGDATSRILYDLDQPARAGRPRLIATLARETHQNPTRIQISFTYIDGLGREIQRKVQAEPGIAPRRHAAAAGLPGALVRNSDGTVVRGPVDNRWVGTGRTVYSNKGHPVRRFDPFFSATHLYESEREVTDTGFTSLLLHDPLGRVVATFHADHTVEKVVFGPWRQVTFDAANTVQLDPGVDPDLRTLLMGPEGERVPAEEYRPTWHALRTDSTYTQEADRRWPDAALRAAERKAATDTADAEGPTGTPSVAHLDVLGRTFLTIADSGTHRLPATRAGHRGQPARGPGPDRQRPRAARHALSLRPGGPAY